MRKYRIREHNSYSEDGTMKFSNFYPEYKCRFLGIFPVWINVTGNPYSSYETLEKAQKKIQEDLNARKNAITKVKDINHIVCVNEKLNKVVDCDASKN